MPMTDKIMCEQCGEAEQEVHLAHAGLCGDCFAQFFSDETKDMFWARVCGRPLFNEAGHMVAVCVQQHGVEHAHGNVSE